jgi:predicted DNA-binding transcriptional regulator AlpA
LCSKKPVVSPRLVTGVTGKTTYCLSSAQVCQRLGISEPTLYRWFNQYGGLKQNESRRLKEPEAENAASSAWSPTWRWTGKCSKR